MAGQTQSFAYDSNSNRTSAVINAATTSYTYPTNSHRLTSLSGATNRSFSYDNAGNVTASAGITYVYDGRGRMKQAAAVRYLVNGLGQRVKKAGASDTFFAYDEAGRLLGEYDAAGAPIQETIWLGDLPIAVIKPNATGFDAFYVWADHLGTPRQITDAANQSRWEWPNADPFGNNAPNENPAGAGAFTYNLRFPGQYYDAETGLNYNYFRDYDPSLGRYIESDPLGLFVAGIPKPRKARPFQFQLNHLYSYTDSRPLSAIDSKGLASVAIGRLLGGAAAGAGRGAGLGAVGLIGGAALGAILSCEVTEQERCERRCDADFDWDKQQCEWVWKMSGRDPDVLRSCMDRARKIYLDCYQDCAK